MKKLKYSLNDSANIHVTEKIVALSEECLEVSVVVSKIQRFGFDSKYPMDNPTNKESLEMEIGHVMEMIDQVVNATGLNWEAIMQHKEGKKRKLEDWLIHQPA